ncbi:hypothetical protein DFH06DRAFT_1204722 [Mycena polygramma]|nr:hypothetical protein DFH06DRAFT_1204722 [Mycena polygramma]
MILLFLPAFVAAAAALPGLSRRTPIVIDSTETCRFRVGYKQYNLCPFFGTAVQWPLLVKGAKTEYRFDLGPEPLGSPDLGSPCPPGTRICFILETLHRAVGSSSATVYPDLDEFNEFITLHFSGGVEGAAAVQLLCDPQARFGQPVFAGVETGVHSFIWRTEYGCAAGGSTLNSLESEDDAPPPDDTPEPSEPDEDSDQLLEGARQRKSRRSAAIIFAVISLIIVTLSIVSYKHPDRLNLLLTDYIQPLFRRLSVRLDHFPRFSIPHSLKPAGEGRLVRWAHEDLELDDSEDVMVNGSDAVDELDEVGDEYIPLRPSPRKLGARVKNYGSATPTSPFW